MKWLRVGILLSLLIPGLFLVWLLTTQSGLQLTYQQAKPWLPETLIMNKMTGRLIGPITVQGFEFRQDGTLIKSEQVTFDWQPAALLTANIDISRIYIRSLTVVLPETEKIQQKQTQHQRTTLPDMNLPWLTIVNNAHIDGALIRQGDQTFNFSNIKLDASSLFSHIDIKQLSIDSESYSLNIAGKLTLADNYKHDLKLNWKTLLPSGEKLEGKGKLAGNLQKTLFKQQLSGALQMTLDAQLNDLLDHFHWNARADVTQLDITRLDTSWPALSGTVKLKASGDLTTAALSGSLNGNYPELGAFDTDFKLQRLGDNSIQIEQLKLHTTDDGIQLESHGFWHPGDNGGDVQLTMNWQSLRWPMQDPAWFNSASGSGTIEGTIDRYTIRLNTASPRPELIASSWSAVAEGNPEGLQIQSLRVKALDGEAVASGQLNWSPALSWQAELTATDINPASLWPQWPGHLNVKLSSSGHFKNEQLVADADIKYLTGNLRSYPVSLRSKLSWREDGIDISQLDLVSGTSRLDAKGRIGETLKLDWNINSNSLAELYPQADGQLQASGRLTGPRQAPTVQASFKGSRLSLPDYRIGSLDATLNLDLLQWQQLDINLAAETLQLDDYSLRSLNINTTKDRIEAKAVSEKLTAQLELRGKADAQGWQGDLVRAEVDSSQYQNWQLEAPAKLGITADNMQLQPLCMLSQQSKICMTLGKQTDIWKAKLDAVKMPLVLLTPWLPEELTLEGTTDAEAELRYQAPDLLLGQANIKLPAGVLTYPLLEGERERWEYQGGKLSIKLDEQGITANSKLTVSDKDHFQFKAELPGARILALDQQQTIRADAQLSVKDLGLIEALIPDVQDLNGDVALDIAATGTLAQPRVSGSAHLRNGSLRIPRLGLTIDPFTLESRSQNLETLNFHIDATSGEGKLAIKGQTTLDRTAGWPTKISIKGNDFEVSRIPEARVQVSPDLQVSLQQRRFDIQGQVHIPYAKLQPKDITTATRISNDAVIVGVERPIEESWLLHTRIRLTLGERVSFYGFGFEGRLGGNLLLEEEPGQLSRATGKMNVPEGRYRAYGQRLDIEHGRLLYTGGPLTNPGLDLRAVRHIDNVTAGIRVRGSLNQPELELFSIPAMGQTDSLAYLLLGGPLEKASGEEGKMMAKAALALGLSGGDHLARTLGDRFGLDEMRVESSDKGDQASLVVGRYLSPKLYVSYGVGLIDAINTLTLRYKISNKWQLKAESGEYQGADFLYTIER